ncbi:hypothetical protein [Hyphomicrobium sp.]|uniref:hypothetical protein n=1 Tax=Hyphomicrobium sp. TaxID=82 RepID=UPI0025C21575|nr:hypothetical protein [Hyphomicrobium sp.]MCC7251894.1 hypothetical protein [Hyphomicrobium sp.]
MKRFRALFAALALLLPAAAHADSKATADDNARVLAGLPPSAGSPLEPLTRDTAWQTHAKYFDKAWDSLEQRQLGKIRAWSAKHVPVRKPVLFYMFSGPDFLYADAFFEGASVYVLSGLEPVGAVPDLAALPPKALGGELRGLQHSLNSVLSFSFFITKKMKTELRDGRLTGTLPILYTFLARSGKTVRETTLVTLNPDGTVTPVADGPLEKGASPGVKITFVSGSGAEQTLYYFSTDLSNWGLKTSGFLAFCKGFGQGDSFVKSASYLMHSDNFSTVRDFVVANTATLVQDDSGVPIRFLDEKDWRIEAFGRYLKPISIFSPKTYQPQMRDLFAKGRAQPLDFGIGYRWRPNESNLLLAVRETVRAEAEQPRP